MLVKGLSFSLAVFGFLISISSVSYADENGNPEDCDLVTGMGSKREEVRTRRTEAVDVGVIQSNDEMIKNMPGPGACTEKLYELMDQVQGSIKSNMGSIISSAIGSQIRDRINSMTCREAERYFTEVMRSKIGEIDDPLGIFTPSGGTGIYTPGRTTTVDVERAIELGRKASEAARSVPMSPPGRSPLSSSSSSSINEDARNAVNSL
mgnify:CR=1 FL=1|tara:strand:+ start:569 stop:1189 length:621 start_codon:yes stop_codon:yes gene_type:complete